MAETFALHEGAFGRIVLLSLRSGLTAHAHSDAHIVWWLGGSEAEARIGTQAFRYSETEASAVNPYEQHDLRLLENGVQAVFLAVYIKKAWLDKNIGNVERPFAFPSPHIPINPDLRAKLWQLLDLMMSGTAPRDIVETSVEGLIVESVKASFVPSGPEAKSQTGPLLSRGLRQAIALMREHIDARLTVDELANRIGLSRARLFALFRDQLNTTPQIFWSALRLEEAIRRIASDNTPLVDVAQDLGFSAPSNFSRFFKEHTGVSPSDYRRAATGALQPLTGLSI